MLIGPTITLVKLEEYMEEKIKINKMEIGKMSKEYSKLQQEMEVTNKMTTDDTGEQVVNPRYLEIINQSQKLEQDMTGLSSNNDFMTSKIEELDGIEKRSNGKVDKTKDKVTLTLNDCLQLGITTEELEKEEVAN